MPKQVRIADEDAAVLRSGVWTTDGTYQLPGQLDRKTYERVDKALRALGGRWDRRARGHRFDADARQALTNALDAGVAVDAARTAEQFFTPPSIATRMFELARLDPSCHVLEPSAGRGALLVEPMRLGCFLTIVERDAALASLLATMLASQHGCGVWADDFTTWEPVARAPIDRVLMNPPFSRGQDMAHVLRALSFLRPGGRLVAVMSPHWVFAKDRAANDFRAALSRLGDDAYDWRVNPPTSFRSSGTDVVTGILTIDKAEA